MTMSGIPDIDLSPHDWQEVKRVLQACVPSHEVWAFGSRARRAAKPYSDLDLAIITEEALPIATMADLRESFDESDMTIKVDEVDWRGPSRRGKALISWNLSLLARELSICQCLVPSPPCVQYCLYASTCTFSLSVAAQALICAAIESCQR